MINHRWNPIVQFGNFERYFSSILHAVWKISPNNTFCVCFSFSQLDLTPRFLRGYSANRCCFNPFTSAIAAGNYFIMKVRLATLIGTTIFALSNAFASFATPPGKDLTKNGHSRTRLSQRKSPLNADKGGALDDKAGFQQNALALRGGDTAASPLISKKLFREMLAELFGTFLIVFIGTGSVSSAIFTDSLVGLFQIASVWIIAVTIAICTTASISGAHLNPAISVAFAIIRPSKSFGWSKVSFLVLYLNVDFATRRFLIVLSTLCNRSGASIQHIPDIGGNFGWLVESYSLQQFDFRLWSNKWNCSCWRIWYRIGKMFWRVLCVSWCFFAASCSSQRRISYFFFPYFYFET